MSSSFRLTLPVHDTTIEFITILLKSYISTRVSRPDAGVTLKGQQNRIFGFSIVNSK